MTLHLIFPDSQHYRHRMHFEVGMNALITARCRSPGSDSSIGPAGKRHHFHCASVCGDVQLSHSPARVALQSLTRTRGEQHSLVIREQKSVWGTT